MDKKIARLAGMNGARMLHTEDGHEVVCFRPDDLDRFAELVAIEEREACARVCDDRHDTWRFGDGEDSTSGPKECAALIRARSNADVTGLAPRKDEQ